MRLLFRCAERKFTSAQNIALLGGSFPNIWRSTRGAIRASPRVYARRSGADKVPISSAAAFARDELVKRVNLGVEQFEGPLPVGNVAAVGRGLASIYRLEKIHAV